MRIIKPNFKIWDQEEGLEGIYKQIERCGRVCYASDPVEGKAKDFVDRMIKLDHGGVLEHGTVYLYLSWDDKKQKEFSKLRVRYITNKFSKVSEKNSYPHGIYITTNLRTLVENNWMDDLQYLCEPTKYHEKRVTVHFTTQIAITREFNRHRVNSMAEQSTRYCDYGGDNKKFAGVGINLPSWIGEEIVEDDLNEDNFKNYCESIAFGDDVLFSEIDYWLFANLACEFSYQNLRRLGWTPQQARTVLPLDTNSQLSHTAFVSDWNHFFGLRDDKQHAHPDAYELAHPLHMEFISKGYLPNEK